MLFNSLTFICVFLPAFLLLYYGLAKRRYGQAVWAIIVFSLIFYGWWNWSFLPLIIISILANFTFGRGIEALHDNNKKQAATALMYIGIGANLSALAFFKYADFFVENVNAAFGTDWIHLNLVLPLAISFFTFQQITFLVDIRNGSLRRPTFAHFAAFVLFFPQLIAGPIVHYNETVPQFANHERQSRSLWENLYQNLSVGLFVFAVGLAKKVVLADTAASYADPIFAAAAQGAELTLIEAWTGALAFAFQIYFDFSGYSDMAIGLARMAGIQLPLNFASPYKSTSIIEFWRRWHITLSRFLRDYLYVPLGGNRHGRPRRYANLIITMLLGGLWHGAAWTFVVWGGLHGFYLVVNHAWRGLQRDRPYLSMGPHLSLILTFGVVLVAWVFFRAHSLQSALQIIASMFTLDSNHGQTSFLAAFGIGRDSALIDGLYVWVRLAAMLFIVWLLPNTTELMTRRGTVPGEPSWIQVPRDLFSGASGYPRLAVLSSLLVAIGAAGLFIPGVALDQFLFGLMLLALALGTIFQSQLRLSWGPTLSWAGLSVGLIFLSLFGILAGNDAEFIYFQF